MRMDHPVQACAKTSQPCAACKTLRRRCTENCLLAPYFPTSDPSKFAIAHKVFGASNIIKLLQVVEECKREDAVRSMVYEAEARIRDPVYGCTGVIQVLQEQVKDLQAHLDVSRVRIRELQEQQEQLLRARMEIQQPQPALPIKDNNSFFVEEESYMGGAEWEPLWTSDYDYSQFSGETSPENQISGSK